MEAGPPRMNSRAAPIGDLRPVGVQAVALPLETHVLLAVDAMPLRNAGQEFRIQLGEFPRLAGSPSEHRDLEDLFQFWMVGTEQVDPDQHGVAKMGKSPFRLFEHIRSDSHIGTNAELFQLVARRELLLDGGVRVICSAKVASLHLYRSQISQRDESIVVVLAVRCEIRDDSLQGRLGGFEIVRQQQHVGDMQTTVDGLRMNRPELGLGAAEQNLEEFERFGLLAVRRERHR